MLTLNKRIVKIFIIFILLFNLILTNSYAIVGKSYEFYVNDTANILESEIEDYIIKINEELESKTGAQIVVVTVTSLEGMSIEDYSITLARNYRYW